jgi:hypothetical protein
MPLRGGYLPVPYVIGLLPFTAVLAAGVGDWLWGVSGAGAAPTLSGQSLDLEACTRVLPVGRHGCDGQWP